jgi:hypothetical protein
MSHNGKPRAPEALEMPMWMIVLVITVMLIIAIFAFWHSARVSYESLPRNQSAVVEQQQQQ